MELALANEMEKNPLLCGTAATVSRIVPHICVSAAPVLSIFNKKTWLKKSSLNYVELLPGITRPRRRSPGGAPRGTYATHLRKSESPPPAGRHLLPSPAGQMPAPAACAGTRAARRHLSPAGARPFPRNPARTVAFL